MEMRKYRDCLVIELTDPNGKLCSCGLTQREGSETIKLDVSDISLTRDMAAELWPLLKRFAETGRLEALTRSRGDE